MRTRLVRSGVLVAAALATCISPAWAERLARKQTERGAPFVLVERDYTRPQRSGPIGIKVDAAGYRELLTRNQAVVRDFPLPEGATVDLELKPFDVLSSDARLVRVDEDGEHVVPRPAFQAYRGKVVGDPDSVVTLSLFENRIAGSIRTWDAEYVVAPRRFNLARRDSTQLQLWKNDDDPDAPEGVFCDTATHPDLDALSVLSEPSLSGPVVESAAVIDGNTLLSADVAIDATYDWYDHFGSLQAAQNYILNVMAQVSTIYENEVGVQIQVPYLRVFQTAGGPYTDGETSTGALLAELRSEWNANQTSVDRTVAHLFSVRPSGGAGVAYVDVLCNHSFLTGNSYDYGVSTLSAGGSSWEKNLVAHELGHNFASPHTHCYVPEIDQCANQNGCYQGQTVSTVGTIMSYCSQKTSTFHPRVRDEKIRPAAEAAFPACVTTAGLPGTLEAGSELTLGKPGQCAESTLANDDGSLNSFFGYTGTTQMAWIKRFTPSCYPFVVDRVDVLFGHSSTVAAGRAIRVLVYTDPSGSGDPANATLAHSEDATVQVVGSAFSEYTLSAPVAVSAGDVYVGVYDLVADPTTNYIATLDTGTEGDAFRTANSTSAQDFSPHSGGTWMIRAEGGPVGSDGLVLQWGPPCNDETTPAQDFAVYRGTIPNFSTYSSVTCSTGRESSYLMTNAADGSFFLIVPRTSANEGSYGLDGDGLERAPAAGSCLPQGVASCP